MSVHNESLLNPTDFSDLKNVNIGIIHTQWNAFLVDKLVAGCKEKLVEHQIPEVKTACVPGSFEIPYACKRLYESLAKMPQPLDAIIAFGSVIKGDTPHFDYVCQAVTEGILQLNLSLPIPIIFGILTVDNIQQAEERIGRSHGHKGKEAALTALQMIRFNRNPGS